MFLISSQLCRAGQITSWDINIPVRGTVKYVQIGAMGENRICTVSAAVVHAGNIINLLEGPVAYSQRWMRIQKAYVDIPVEAGDSVRTYVFGPEKDVYFGCAIIIEV